MNAEEMWKKYCAENSVDINARHDVWAFGAAPDELAKLVLKGIKTATASAYDLYFIDPESEALPEVGGYSIILNSKDEALCIIQTTKVTIVPFSKVTSEHAYKEGEGDRSLKYWREVHKEFFNDEFKKYNLKLNNKTKIVCEEFKLLYK